MEEEKSQLIISKVIENAYEHFKSTALYKASRVFGANKENNFSDIPVPKQITIIDKYLRTKTGKEISKNMSSIRELCYKRCIDPVLDEHPLVKAVVEKNISLEKLTDRLSDDFKTVKMARRKYDNETFDKAAKEYAKGFSAARGLISKLTKYPSHGHDLDLYELLVGKTVLTNGALIIDTFPYMFGDVPGNVTTEKDLVNSIFRMMKGRAKEADEILSIAYPLTAENKDNGNKKTLLDAVKEKNGEKDE